MPTPVKPTCASSGQVRRSKPSSAVIGSFGWYDVILKVTEDSTFEWRLAGHVETGRDSYSDPALGGLVTLKI